MDKTSNVNDLKTRLQQKIEQDHEAIEALTESELKVLAETLTKQYRDALRTIASDMETETQTLIAQTGEVMKGAAEQAATNWRNKLEGAMQATIAPTTETARRIAGTMKRTSANAQTLEETLQRIERQAAMTKTALLKATLMPILVGLLVLLMLFGGAWAMMQHQAATIRDQSAEISRQRQVLAELDAEGIEIATDPETKRKVILHPMGSEMGLLCDNRPCSRLP